MASGRLAVRATRAYLAAVPEGDSLYKLAARLRPLLDGQRVASFSTRQHGQVEGLVGSTITEVASRGKHLLVSFDGKWVLRVHLGMKGRGRSWPREPGREPPWGASVTLRTAAHDVVIVNAAQTELVRARWLDQSPALARLGPDLLEDPVDFDEVLRRARSPERAEWGLGELLLDQRVAAGVGNVYKCEALFMARLNPWLAVQDVTDAELRSLYQLARELMQANLRSGLRRTVGFGTRPWAPRPDETQRLWVYQQSRRGCLVCHGKIRFQRQGGQARGTWWCPTCQPAAQPA